MKQELLEYLIRQCVREVLTQTQEQEEPQGGMAPPADGQGTGDEPEIPKDREQHPSEEPEQPETPPAPKLRGIVFVNPKDKAKLQKIDIRSKDPASIERELHNLGARMAGSRVKVSLSAARMVKDVLNNPNTSLYLYLGKYDPNSDETFLMADKSLQVAKDSSISPVELTGAPSSPTAQEFQPLTAQPGEFARQMTAGGQTPVHGVDEVLRKVIKKMINEVLDTK